MARRVLFVFLIIQMDLKLFSIFVLLLIHTSPPFSTLSFHLLAREPTDHHHSRSLDYGAFSIYKTYFAIQSELENVVKSMRRC